MDLLFSRIWARLPATMVAEMASIVADCKHSKEHKFDSSLVLTDHNMVL